MNPQIRQQVNTEGSLHSHPEGLEIRTLRLNGLSGRFVWKGVVRHRLNEGYVTGRSWHGETGLQEDWTGQVGGDQRTLRLQKPSPVFISIRSMTPYLSNSLSISLGVAPYSKFPQKTCKFQNVYCREVDVAGKACLIADAPAGRCHTP